MLALCLGPVAWGTPWPSDADWQALVADDPMADTVGDGDDTHDLVGDAVDPVLSWDVTGDRVYLRLRVSADPTGAPHDRGILFDTDGNDLDFELALLVQGAGLDVVPWFNGAGTNGTWVAGLTAQGGVVGSAAGGEVRIATAGDGWALEIGLPRSVWSTTLGIDDTTALRMTAVTAVVWPLGWEDVAGCDGTASPCADLAPSLSGTVRIDGDLDGLSDPEEDRAGTDPEDADTDDDGLLDGLEALDLDGDGVVDALECDADDDGLADGTEVGITVADGSTDPDGCFVADADPLTTTDPLDGDSDGGGLLDGIEDHDHDGLVDPWEGDPNDPTDDADADGDSVPDIFDDLFGAGADDDGDGDGLTDEEEGFADTDGDDVPDFADLDSDDDGLPDGPDGLTDVDGDTIPAYRDPDSDGDGIEDGVEGDGDTDEDDIPDFEDLDSDDDDIRDEIEGDGDTDEDGIPDFQDTDSDGDGIEDGDERNIDTDDDGIPDYLDLDSDGDTIPDAVEMDVDTDGDGVPDFQDTDSDNDDRLDRDEVDGDRDCDGEPDRTDPTNEDGFCETGLVPPATTTWCAPDPRPAPPTGRCTTGAVPGAPWGLVIGLCLIRRMRP